MFRFSQNQVVEHDALLVCADSNEFLAESPVRSPVLLTAAHPLSSENGMKYHRLHKTKRRFGERERETEGVERRRERVTSGEGGLTHIDNSPLLPYILCSSSKRQGESSSFLF